VIKAFLESWPLFGDAWLSGALLALSLALAGVVVVARDQVFVGAAVAQASTLGISVGLLAGLEVPGPLAAAEGGSGLSWMAVGFGVAASLLLGLRRPPGRETRESLTGWVFLVASGLSILLLTESPQGLKEVQRVLTSSLIGAGPEDVLWLLGLAAFGVGFVLWGGPRLVLLAVDPPMAEAVGLRTRVWSAVTSLWIGVVLGLSIRVAGTLFAFGCLVLPVMAARNVCRRSLPLFLWSPVVAVAVTGVAFVLAHGWDHPPAQEAVALLAGTVAATWAYDAAMRRFGRAP
jgi:ABC-type Mn2+/Zn2+ transport system permease subunit